MLARHSLMANRAERQSDRPRGAGRKAPKQSGGEFKLSAKWISADATQSPNPSAQARDRPLPLFDVQEEQPGLARQQQQQPPSEPRERQRLADLQAKLQQLLQLELKEEGLAG